MIRIIIRESLYFRNLEILQSVIKPSWKLKKIEIAYNPDKGLPFEDDYNDYPFKLFFLTSNSDLVEVDIYSLTVGSGGTGPRTTANILRYFGVNYQESMLFSKMMRGEDGYIRIKYTL